MYPKEHILMGIPFSLVLWLIFPQIEFLGIIIIFLSSVLIDFDHYAVYVYRKKDLSLERAYKWYFHLKKVYPKEVKKNPKLKMPFNLLHTIEFLLLIFVLYFYYKFFLWILLGFLFHFIVDMIDMSHRKVFNAREYSLIKYLISDKRNYL